MAIDNNLENNELVGSYHQVLELNSAGTHLDEDAVFPVHRRDFTAANSPVAFPIVFRQLHCDSCE